jgi:hypothetical protein
MSMIEKILNGFGYEKIQRGYLSDDFGKAHRNLFQTLSDTWEEKVAGPARERRAERRSRSSNGVSNSSTDSGWSWSFGFGDGGGGGGGDCGGGGDGGGGGGGE